MMKIKLSAAFLLVAALLLIAHLIRLNADPTPKFSLIGGDDHSADLYTDEGFDSSGAIALSRFGDWYVPGGFNLSVEAPLWSAVLATAFHFFGYSLALARGIEVGFYALSVLIVYLFLKEWRPQNDSVPAWSVIILMSSFFGFCLSRLAILEVIWTFFVLVALLLCTLACRHASLLISYAAGLAYACAMLTKLSAVSAIIPMLAVFLIDKPAPGKRLFLAAAAICGTLTLMLPYELAVVHFYRPDQIYYMHINLADRSVSSPLEWLRSVYHVLSSSRYFELPLCAAFVLGACFFCMRVRKLFDQPLLLITSIWLISNILMASRLTYYPARYALHALFPFVILSVLFADAALKKSRLAGYLIYTLLSLSVLVGSAEMLFFLSHPAYSLKTVARDIHQICVRQAPCSVMGDPAYTMAFYENLLPLNDGFGATPRTDRINSSSPGYLLTIGRASSDREHDFEASGRKLHLLRSFSALGDYLEGKELYLYKVDRRS